MLRASGYGIGLLFISLRRANVWEPSVRRRSLDVEFPALTQGQDSNPQTWYLLLLKGQITSADLGGRNGTGERGWIVGIELNVLQKCSRECGTNPGQTLNYSYPRKHEIICDKLHQYRSALIPWSE